MISGRTYNFRVRAKNIWGWGQFSSITGIKAASAPGQMSPVTASIDLTTGNVRISWSAPASNSEPITKYKIEILRSDGTTFSEDLTHCDGSSSIILANMYCIVPMSVLRSSPYSLTYGTIVKARASAFNQFGWGAVSTTNTAGATIRTEPIQMIAPLRGSETSTT